MKAKNKIIIPNLFRTSLIQEVLEYLFVFSLILNMRSVFMHTPKTGFMKTLVILMMGGCVCGVILCKRKFTQTQFCFGTACAVGLTLYLGLFYLLQKEPDNSLIKIIVEIAVIALYVFIGESSTQKTMKQFTDIMVIIAGISLLFWVGVSQLHLLSPTGAWKLDWGNAVGMENGCMNVYYGIYFETQTITFGAGELVRNSAIFSEAPMCSFMFTVALLGELFLTEKPGKFRTAILFLGVITTIATSGIVLSTAGIGIWYLQKKGLKLSGSFLDMFVRIVIVPCLVIAIGVFAYSIVSSKLDTHSGASRTSDFVNGFHAWADKPLLGYGFGSEPLKTRYGSYGFSNSIIPVLTQGGIYLFLLYLLPLIHVFIANLLKQDLKRLVFYGLFFSAFVITIVPFQNLTFYLFITMIKPEHSRTSLPDISALLERRKKHGSFR